MVTMAQLLQAKSLEGTIMPKKTRMAFFSGRVAPPGHVNSVLDLYESDVVHVELPADVQPAFSAFSTLQDCEEPNQNR